MNFFYVKLSGGERAMVNLDRVLYVLEARDGLAQFFLSVAGRQSSSLMTAERYEDIVRVMRDS